MVGCGASRTGSLFSERLRFEGLDEVEPAASAVLVAARKVCETLGPGDVGELHAVHIGRLVSLLLPVVDRHSSDAEFVGESLFRPVQCSPKAGDGLMDLHMRTTLLPSKLVNQGRMTGESASGRVRGVGVRDDIGEIVEEVRGKMRQDEFAKSLGVSPSYISRIETGDAIPGPKFIKTLGEKYDRIAGRKLLALYRKHHELEDEDTDEGPPAPVVKSPARKDGFLPLVGRAACGTWMEAVETGSRPSGEKTWLYVGKQLGSRGDCYCVEAEGDSMTGPTPSGESIEDGDVLIVDPNPDLLVNGKVALVRLGSKLTVKIYFDAGDHLILTPTNPRHKRLEPTKAEFDEEGGIAHRIVKVQKTRDL